ncbi:zf-HC2 domain-containing protein [Gorillibacterium sp. CAU 1737]|uniref:zf-HC2 domain-containing protein n=1 Tax=Gorillibacterium sp. CAU 1737 TaxID=3140362 RepID=UPI0032619322
MNVSCEIIKDLLPLYHDGVCSSDSRKLVEEHLASCESCRAELEAMDRQLPLNQVQTHWNEATAVTNLAKEWKKSMVKALLKGILITAAIALVLYFLMDLRVVDATIP